MRSRWLGLGAAALFPAVVFACGLDDSVVLQGGAADGGGLDGTLTSDGSATDGRAPNDGAVTNDSGETNPPVLNVYATTTTELYSFEVIAGKLTDVGALTNCGATTNFADLALDSTGQLYVLKLSDAVYKLDRAGNCSTRWVLMSTTAPNDGPFIDKIAARNNGNPALVALNGTNNDYYDIDVATPNTAALAKLNSDLFTDDSTANQFGVYDLTCRKDGTCWTALTAGCSPGIGSSCLYTFKDDGNAAATALGAINVQPAGLVYAMGSLYSFGLDGKILKISLGGVPVAQTVTVTGAALPAVWSGAASGSNNP